MNARRLTRGEAKLADLAAALDSLGVGSGDDFLVSPAALADEARARTGDPTTSHDAALSVEDLRASQTAVLRCFETFGEPLTDERLITIYRSTPDVPAQSDSGLRTRRHELVAGGLLIDTEQTEEISTGRRATLWGLPPEPTSPVADPPAGLMPALEASIAAPSSRPSMYSTED